MAAAKARKKKATTKKATRKATKRATSGPKKSPEQKARRGRVGKPPFRPTKEDRMRVELLASILTQEEIVGLVFNPATGKPIDSKTLRRYFRYELDKGMAKVHAKVGESLIKRALDMEHPQGATCAIFIAKTRMGWSETHRVEVDGKAGVLVAPGVVSVEDWLSKVATRNAAATEPGLVEPD